MSHEHRRNMRPRGKDLDRRESVRGNLHQMVPVEQWLKRYVFVTGVGYDLVSPPPPAAGFTLKMVDVAPGGADGNIDGVNEATGLLDGTVNLGPTYGRIRVVGLTIEEAEHRGAWRRPEEEGRD